MFLITNKMIKKLKKIEKNQKTSSVTTYDATGTSECLGWPIHKLEKVEMQVENRSKLRGIGALTIEKNATVSQAIDHFCACVIGYRSTNSSFGWL